MKFFNITIVVLFLTFHSSTMQGSQQKKRPCMSPAKIALGVVLIASPLFIAHSGMPCLPCIVNSPYMPSFSSTHVEQTSINHCLPCVETIDAKQNIRKYIKDNPYPKDLTAARKKTSKP